MSLIDEARLAQAEFATRRQFLKTCSMGLGAMALGSLGGIEAMANTGNSQTGLSVPHFAPKAKRVIYLHMAGSPSQLELFDYKPELERLNQQLCPPSLLEGKRFAFISGTPKMLGPQAKFSQHGQSGAWISNHLPQLSTMSDEICFLKAHAH